MRIKKSLMAASIYTTLLSRYIHLVKQIHLKKKSLIKLKVLAKEDFN